MSTAMPILSITVPFHREGVIAGWTLRSIDRCRRFFEQKIGKTELVCALDNADSETITVVENHATLRNSDVVFHTKNGNLAETRNELIKNSRADVVQILDGDDYYSINLLFNGFVAIKSRIFETVVHPDYIITFEEMYLIQKFSNEIVDPISMFALHSVNPWPSTSIANKKTFEAYPYVRTDVKNTGFAFEDWHWNLEVRSAGILHTTVDSTALYYRKKKNSLLNQEVRSGGVLRNSNFFTKFTI
jgi:glycosyltransferase involved in cell wall biosynthesis